MNGSGGDSERSIIVHGALSGGLGRDLRAAQVLYEVVDRAF